MPRNHHPPPPTCEIDTEDEEWTKIPSNRPTPNEGSEGESPQQSRHQQGQESPSSSQLYRPSHYYGAMFFSCLYLLSTHILLRLYIVFEIPTNAFTIAAIYYLSWEFRILYKNLIECHLPMVPCLPTGQIPLYSERTRAAKNVERLFWYALFVFWYGWLRLLENVMDCVDDAVWGENRGWRFQYNRDYFWMMKAGLLFMAESVVENCGYKLGFWDRAKAASLVPLHIGLLLLGLR